MIKKKKISKNNVVKFFVSEEVLPQTISLLETRSNPLGIKLVKGNHETFEFSDEYFGAMLQYPGKFGKIYDYKSFVKKAKNFFK